MSFEIAENINGELGVLPTENTLISPKFSTRQPISCAVTLNIKSK